MQKKNKTIIRCVLTALSSGWVVPAYGAMISYTRYLELLQEDTQMDSFPHLSFAESNLRITIVWLLAVIAFWTWVSSKNLFKER